MRPARGVNGLPGIVKICKFRPGPPAEGRDSVTTPAHILIIEDDPVTRRRLAGYLRQQHYRVSEAPDAAQAQAILDREPAELLIVDIGLEGTKDGLAVTREQRAASDVGIILLTSLNEQVDRIVGLELGADDYVTKPFDQRELLARVKNLLRRVAAGRTAKAEDGERLRFGGWTLDGAGRALVNAEGQDVPLTSAEFHLLHHMARHPGAVQSRSRLMRVISHRDWNADDRTVDVLIGRLRRKFGANPPARIATVHGEGYSFTPAASPPA